MSTRDALHTLQLGPVWMLSAITGTGTTFTPLDLEVFADVLDQVIRRTPREARTILESVRAAGTGLFLDFELDERPLVSGVRDVAAALEAEDAELATDVKLALFRIGAGIARARGPYGRQITPENEQLLLLLAELLDLRLASETPG